MKNKLSNLIVFFLIVGAYYGSEAFAKSIGDEAAVQLNNSGVHEMNIGNNSEAFRLFSEAINSDKNYALPYLNRGILKRILKDNLGALPDYDAIVRISPQNWGYRVARAKLLEELGDYKGAVEDYSHAIAIYPVYKELWQKELARLKSKLEDKPGSEIRP